jgi:hypothetical protein
MAKKKVGRPKKKIEPKVVPVEDLELPELDPEEPVLETTAEDTQVINYSDEVMKPGPERNLPGAPAENEPPPPDIYTGIPGFIPGPKPLKVELSDEEKPLPRPTKMNRRLTKVLDALEEVRDKEPMALAAAKLMNNLTNRNLDPNDKFCVHDHLTGTDPVRDAARLISLEMHHEGLEGIGVDFEEVVRFTWSFIQDVLEVGKVLLVFC